ncbi:MAG: NYN domain-containing protein [Acidobacteria bacterium]|nr:NYN domain-containing protein [Acidobacteriota bacterium]
MLEHNRCMIFVDGENFTIRAQEIVGQSKSKLVEGENYRENCFVWFPKCHPHFLATLHSRTPGFGLVRASYYTSVNNDEELKDIRIKLWKLGFNPNVFKKKRKDQKAKGVDIALTKDMLSHAFLGNYDIAILLAGDGDYVPLVEEVKRLGRRVWVSFFDQNGLSEDLRLVSDHFSDITNAFLSAWKIQSG